MYTPDILLGLIPGVGFPSSAHLPDPGLNLRSPVFQAFFTIWATKYLTSQVFVIEKLNCIPSKFIHIWTPKPHVSLREVIRVKTRFKSGALIQYDWCPCKKRRHQRSFSFGGNERKVTVYKTWKKSHQKPTLMAPWSWILPSRTVREHISVKIPKLWYFSLES